MWNPFQGIVSILCNYGGLDRASGKILTCLFLSFPFSAIFKRLPDAQIKLKNSYILVVSIIYIFFILEIFTGFFILLGNALFTYLITRYYKSKFMPWVNLIGLMGFLAISHLKTQFTRLDSSEDLEIDVTGAQMVLVMKLSAFAWSYWDGITYLKDKERFARLTTYQQSRVILEHPNLFTYLGYVFFYATLVTGPSFDYSDYSKFIATDLFDDVPEEKRPGKKRKRKIPKSGKIAAKKVAMGFGWIILLLLLDKYDTIWIQSQEFRDKNFAFKIFYLWLVAFVARLKYYGVWLISEGGCILVGLGYNGYDKKSGKMFWNRVQNIDPIGFEFGLNFHDCIEAWNMNTNKWLKNCIYLRTCTWDEKKGKWKAGLIPSLITFFTSAFWHGTLPGYYLTFILGAFMQSVGKIFRRTFRPIFINKSGKQSKWKWAYDFVGWIISQLSFGYVTASFLLLRLDLTLALWKSCYFWVHLCCAIVLSLFGGPAGGAIRGFFKKWHMKEEEIADIEHPQLVQLRGKVQSTSDLLAQLKNQKSTSSIDLKSSSSEIAIPKYDNQEELATGMQVPDFDGLETTLNKLHQELNEWKAAKNKFVKEDEIKRLNDAILALEKDIESLL
ncbi:lysophospholipid acyltransferase [Martiniozyma asiatica (nom. inval.)]|nr:lysophospholipid acyltransferase [Martiniozyma asiatica]